MNAHDIIIGGLRIAFDSAYGLTQTYEEIGGSIVHRMLDGSAVKQQHWSKLRTVIEGRGRIPPGLESLDYTASIVIDCMAPIALAHASNNVFTLPAARRPQAARRTDRNHARIACRRHRTPAWPGDQWPISARWHARLIPPL